MKKSILWVSVPAAVWFFVSCFDGPTGGGEPQMGKSATITYRSEGNYLIFPSSPDTEFICNGSAVDTEIYDDGNAFDTTVIEWAGNDTLKIHFSWNEGRGPDTLRDSLGGVQAI